MRAPPPDRHAQFECINAQVQAFQAAGRPAIPVGTKKKELAGDFKNAGRELRPKGQPEPVRVHGFALPELGKVAPHGAYGIAANTGWVNLGITSDTAAFAVESIRRWWHELGQPRHPGAERLQRNPKDLRVITADCGGSNRARVRLWKTEWQALADQADQAGLSITVAHLPPGTSKCNRIEHRLFAFITQNWRGKPLPTHQAIVQLIASTTQAGLTVPPGRERRRERHQGLRHPGRPPQHHPSRLPWRMELHHRTTKTRELMRLFWLRP